jgi:hypothetical protein
LCRRCYTINDYYLATFVARAKENSIEGFAIRELILMSLILFDLEELVDAPVY